MGLFAQGVDTVVKIIFDYRECFKSVGVIKDGKKEVGVISTETTAQIGRVAEIAALFIGLLILTAMAYKKCAIHKWTKKQGFFATLAGAYIMLAFMYTIVLRSPYKGVHLKLLPLWRLSKIGRYELHEVIKEILTNVILLFPLGFIIYAGFPRTKIRTIIAIGFGLSLMIEALQYISQRGAFEIDDLVFNVIGIFLGLILGRLVIIKKKCNAEGNGTKS